MVSFLTLNTWLYKAGRYMRYMFFFLAFNQESSNVNIGWQRSTASLWETQARWPGSTEVSCAQLVWFALRLFFYVCCAGGIFFRPVLRLAFQCPVHSLCPWAAAVAATAATTVQRKAVVCGWYTSNAATFSLPSGPPSMNTAIAESVVRRQDALPCVGVSSSF